MEKVTVKYVETFRAKNGETLDIYAVTSDSKQYVQDARDRDREDYMIFFEDNGKTPKEYVGKARYVSSDFIGQEAVLNRVWSDANNRYYWVDDLCEELVWYYRFHAKKFRTGE